MSTATMPRLALVGSPNAGKTALFNLLTGSRQKVANYAGVTVERKEGRFETPGGQHWRLLDLPGAYSLQALTPDEQVTVEDQVTDIESQLDGLDDAELQDDTLSDTSLYEN